jgi:hypothetical protein
VRSPLQIGAVAEEAAGNAEIETEIERAIERGATADVGTGVRVAARPTTIPMMSAGIRSHCPERSPDALLGGQKS